MNYYRDEVELIYVCLLLNPCEELCLCVIKQLHNNEYGYDTLLYSFVFDTLRVCSIEDVLHLKV